MTSHATAIERYLTWPATRRCAYGWGRVALGLLLLVAGCGLVVTVVGTVIALATLGEGANPSASPAPVLMVVQMAVSGLWALVVWGVARGVFRMSFADLVSWVPGVRWGLLGKATLISLVGLGAYTIAVALAKGTPVVPLTGEMIVAIVAAILLIPFQALAEELLFRAFGPQVVLGRIGHDTAKYAVVAVVSSAIFASLHGASNTIAWLTFLIFGLVFAVLVRTTAGVEAAFALHAVNNVLLVVSGILTGRNLTAVQGDVVVDLAVVAQVVVVVAIAAAIPLVTRRERAATGPVAARAG